MAVQISCRPAVLEELDGRGDVRLQLDDVGAVAERLHVDERLHPLQALPRHLPYARHAHLHKQVQKLICRVTHQDGKNIP